MLSRATLTSNVRQPFFWAAFVFEILLIIPWMNDEKATLTGIVVQATLYLFFIWWLTYFLIRREMRQELGVFWQSFIGFFAAWEALFISLYLPLLITKFAGYMFGHPEWSQPFEFTWSNTKTAYSILMIEMVIGIPLALLSAFIHCLVLKYMETSKEIESS
jgi:hypothetical protein